MSANVSSKSLWPSNEADIEILSRVLHEPVECLQKEVHKAECILQREIDSMWQKMVNLLEQRTQDYESKYSLLEKENVSLKEQINTVSRSKSDVEQQNQKLISDLESLTNKNTILTEELHSVKTQLKSKDDITDKQLALNKEHRSEISSYQNKLKEQANILKEYQEKVTMVTGKMHKLSHQLSSEKNVYDREKKLLSSQLSHQSAEAKKMELQLIKLKSQISTSNKALAAAKEESRILQIQFKKSMNASDSALADVQKEHLSTIRTLKEKISSLEHEIEELKMIHQHEIDHLKRQQIGIDRDTFLDARITFLQHQNRQEKVKFCKELKK